MVRALSRCPVCDGALTISELRCDQCETLVRNAFAACRFCGLSDDQTTFLETFLRNRGNLSGVAAEQGVSFPTASRRLDALLESVGVRPQTPARNEGLSSSRRDDERRRILELLDRGEITAEAATRRIRDIG